MGSSVIGLVIFFFSVSFLRKNMGPALFFFLSLTHILIFLFMDD